MRAPLIKTKEGMCQIKRHRDTKTKEGVCQIKRPRDTLTKPKKECVRLNVPVTQNKPQDLHNTIQVL